jgi:hypothetical protein
MEKILIILHARIISIHMFNAEVWRAQHPPATHTL